MTPTSKYKRISKETFETSVIAEQKPSLLLFGAKWSGKAELMDNMVSRISGEFNHGIHFFKVDVEEQSEISKFFQVNSVPTILLIKDGEVQDFIKGLISAHKLRSKINTVFLIKE